MRSWCGVALATSDPGAGRMASRLPVHLHPLAGRPLAWHSLHALATLRPPPERLVLVAGPELTPETFRDLPVPVAVVPAEAPDLAAAVHDAGVPVDSDASFVIVDAAASLPPTSLQHMVDAGSAALLLDPDDRPLAASLPFAEACAFLREGAPLARLAESSRADVVRSEEEGFLVTCREELCRASARVRDRLVSALMDGGTTFLLPQTVLVDVDVRIGRDTVIYPGVVIEGQTTVGDETVIGPYCRIVESWIGSGVELKGFNYISHTSIRNRAILEPHARRGFD